ncbi:MAG: hypothetical protein AAFN00_05115 [Cyanobacteria bacterium J06558_2]
MLENNSIAESINQYDKSYQYGVMLEINNCIMGTAFIPFDQSVQLELAINQAVDNYKTNKL